MTKKSFLTVTDQFCGAGGSSLGATAIPDLNVYLAMNHWALAIDTHNTNFPDTYHDLADVSAVDPRRYPSTDILVTSPECFPAGTLILTTRGLVPIEDVVVGDTVFTHRGRWMPVTSTMDRLAATRIVKGQGHTAGLEVTSNHPFYVRRQSRRWVGNGHGYAREFSQPLWVSPYAMECDGFTYRWATPVNVGAIPIPEIPDRPMPLDDPDFWWLVGRWLADGSLSIRPDHGHEITISCGRHRADELEAALSRWSPLGNGRSGAGELRWRRRSVRTAELFETGHSALAIWLEAHFGKLAHGKTIPAWAFGMAAECRQAFLDGYISGDGHITDRYTQASTVSKPLAIGVRLLAESLGFRVSLARYDNSRASVIEGREVNVRDVWVVRWENNGSQRNAFADGDHSWSLIKRIDEGNRGVRVYNLSVAEDESYVADGIVVHNCTNHSVAKGARRRRKQMHLWEKEVMDPSVERSRATMWDAPRFAEYHQYNIIVTENVVDARQWIMWDAWIHAMNSLGYDHHIVYFNSMFAHLDPRRVQTLHDFAPQSRDRMYVVFWKKGNKAPNLDFRPRAYCPKCETEVGAVQAFKPTKVVRQLGGRWGRYGDQYNYLCPTCANEVQPYHFAAFNAIDWSLPAERIGDRKRPLKEKTIQRIEEGLRRFAGQYLMIELGHSHAENNRSRPLSGPFFTQTACQTQGLAMPFLSVQYTPGYNKPITDSMATVTAQDHHALAMPMLVQLAYGNQTNCTESVAGTIFTQTTTESVALAIPPFTAVLRGTNRAKGMDDPLDTFAANGNHHGLVMPAPFMTSYYGSNGNQRTVDDAMGTLTAGDRHGLVMPFLLGYANGDGPAKSAVEPLRTVHTENGQALVQPTEIPNVEDVHFRMLQPHEVGRGMAFPETYIVKGTKRDQVKQYGNAVTPPVMKMILERCVETLR